MSKETMFASALLSLVVLASCASDPDPLSDVGGTAPSGAAVEEGSFAPEFTLGSAAGTEVSLSEFRGTPVLLYFSMGPG
jgi:cytochrome oxidase Cu insertion factor (SCO1/SenC/PrrC family)